MEFYYEINPFEEMTGKKLESTWWGDFRVGAELGGLEGIKDTYKRGLQLAKEDKLYGTEFSLVLNWLSHFYADQTIQAKYRDSLKKSELFTKLWLEFHNWVLHNWKGEDLSYYLTEID